MLFIDYSFFYKNIIRQILCNKFLIRNRYAIPHVAKLLFFFSLTKIEDVDDVQIYNYIYLFKYFFGRRAFLTRIKSFFDVGKWSYSLNVNVCIIDMTIYQKLFFYINDICLMSETSHIKKGIYSSKINIYYIVLKDLTIFSESKTNLGLFFLKEPLNLHIFFKGGDNSYLSYFINNFKMRLI